MNLMGEGYVNKAVEPLEQVRIVAREARNIPNLPQHVDQYLVRIIGEIGRAISRQKIRSKSLLVLAIDTSAPLPGLEFNQGYP
jgi:hypothetical protein